MISNNDTKTILVTGVAGFIGFHLCRKLLCEGHPIIGIDNLNSYYDVRLKKERLKILKKLSAKKAIPFEFYKLNIENKNDLENIFKSENHSEEFFKRNPPQIVVNLAAQAGVRYSLENPSSYIQSNVVGFLNILECCRSFKINHLVYL